MNFNDKTAKIVILLLVLATSFFVIFDARADHAYPRHFDEFQDIGIANDILDTGKLAFLDSKTGFERADHDSFNRNLEMGFHVFLAELSTVSGIDLIFDYKYLPAIFSVFIIDNLTGDNIFSCLVKKTYKLAISCSINVSWLLKL